MAYSLEGLEDFHEAIETYKSIGSISDYFVKGTVRIAMIHLRMGAIPKGIAVVKRSLGVLPDSLELTVALGELYLRAGRAAEAVEWLLKGVTKNPGSEMILYTLGTAYEKAHRIDDALVTMGEILKINSRNPDALNFIAYEYAQMGTNLETAERYAKRALKIRPDSGYIVDTLGWVYFNQGRTLEAIAELEKAAMLAPEEKDIHEHLGDAYAKDERHSRALAAYLRALKLVESDEGVTERLKNKVRAVKVRLTKAH